MLCGLPAKWQSSLARPSMRILDACRAGVINGPPFGEALRCAAACLDLGESERSCGINPLAKG